MSEPLGAPQWGYRTEDDYMSVPEVDRLDLSVAAAMIDRMAPILHGEEPVAQSIALAHLLHVWLCGLHINGADDEGPDTQALRERALEEHIGLVRQLVEAEVSERVRQATERDGERDGE